MYGICACTLTYLEEEAGIASNPGPLSRARARARKNGGKLEKTEEKREGLGQFGNLGNVV